MELIEGVEASQKNLIFKRNKRKLANEIVDNLIKIHSVHNDKYDLSTTPFITLGTNIMKILRKKQ